jgi:hypothetical protein
VTGDTAAPRLGAGCPGGRCPCASDGGMTATPEGIAGKVAGSSTFGGGGAVTPGERGAGEKTIGSCVPGCASGDCWALTESMIPMKRAATAAPQIAGLMSASPTQTLPAGGGFIGSSRQAPLGRGGQFTNGPRQLHQRLADRIQRPLIPIEPRIAASE